MQIKLSLIDADPEQPRQVFVEAELQELVSSIRAKGILTPLAIEKDYAPDKQGRYLLLDGERRYRSAKKLQLDEVPATIIQGPLTFEERTIRRFHIQEQHKNWSFFDKARAIALLKQRSNLTLAEIAEQLNMQAPIVHAWVSVTEFTEQGQKLIIEKKIRFTYLITLIRAVKRYVELTNREQFAIEQLLITRLVAGELGTVADMTKFSQLLFDHTHAEEKTRFLDDREYSLSDFFRETGAAKILQSAEIYKLSEELLQSLKVAINEKSSLALPARNSLQKLSEIILHI